MSKDEPIGTILIFYQKRILGPWSKIALMLAWGTVFHLELS